MALATEIKTGDVIVLADGETRVTVTRSRVWMQKIEWKDASGKDRYMLYLASDLITVEPAGNV